MEELNPEKIVGESVSENVSAEPSEIHEDAMPEAPEPASPAPKLSRMKIVTAVFNGLGIGFLLGTLWSLSTEPVIGGVIATLSSLLALFLGLNEKFLDPLKSIRIGAFGFAAVAGIIMGFYIRANDPFSPTLLDKKEEYKALGYSDAEARAFVTKRILADSAAARNEDNVLYSSSVALNECNNLRSINETYKRIDIEGIPSGYLTGTWKEFVDVFLEDFEGDQVVTAIITMRSCFCPDEGGSGELNITSSDELKRLEESNSLEEIESVLSSQNGSIWQTIATKIKENFPDLDERKTMYLAVIKVLSHD